MLARQKYQLFTGDRESDHCIKDILKLDRREQKWVLPLGYGNGRNKVGRDGGIELRLSAELRAVRQGLI